MQKTALFADSSFLFCVPYSVHIVYGVLPIGTKYDKISKEINYYEVISVIRFVCGRSGTGKSEYVMEYLKAQNSSDKKIILIVPEQQAVSFENRTARELDAARQLSLEVLTFTRLSDRTSREYGGFFHNCAGRSAKQLLMWAALESVRGSMAYYGNSATARLVPAMLKTVKELRTYRVTPSDLETAADSLGGGDAMEELLSKKLGDISMIYAAYEELLHESFSDSEDIPDHTASVVEEKKFFSGKTVIIDGFYSVTPAQKDIIRSAMRDACELIITVACPEKETGEPQFVHIREYFDGLCAMAKDFGGSETVSLEEQKRFSTPALGVLERGIWRFGDKTCSDDHEGVTLLRVKDRYAEGDAAASMICRFVREGVRYSDIALIARNAEVLEGITDAALQRRGIPHYTSRRKKLASSPAARLLLAAMRVPAYGWRMEDVLNIAKTGLLSLSEDECDYFEKYLRMWRLRGERAYTDGDWGMDPFGYKQSSAERSAQILENINHARAKLCDPLGAFCEIFRGGAAKAADCAVALYKLLTDWEVPSAINKTATELRRLGYTTEAAETLRLWDALMSVLDTLATTIPDAEGDAESFSLMLSQIISATDSGTIPTGIDEVVIGSADMMRTENLRHVIILGAVDGEFPAAAPKDGILSETDRVMLEGCGIELSDSGRNAAGMEMFWFYKAVSAASESVTVMIPEYSGNSPCTPSLGVAGIKELFPSISTVRYDGDDPQLSVWTRGDLESFVRFEDERGQCARALLPEYKDIPTYGDCGMHDASEERIPSELMRELCGNSLTLTQSKLEKFAECPFKYSAAYTLRLEDDLLGRIDYSDTGSFVHKILEEYFAEVKDMDFPIPEDVEREICDRIFEKHIRRVWDKGLSGGRGRFLFRKLRESIGVFVRSLNEEFTQGLFRPWRFEQPVGSEDESAIESPAFYLSDGTVIRMKGVIDRIDVYKEDGVTYVRVVDYKTGSKEFSLKDIYKGLNLQLLLYLFTVWKCPPGEFRRALAGEGGEIIPAGALYFSARPGETGAEGMLYGEDAVMAAVRNVSRTGLVLSDRHILEAMDRELSGLYAPAKTDKSGEIKKSAALADIEYFGKLYLDISDIIKKMGEEIYSGKAGAVPQSHGGRDACEYCNYYPICRAKGKCDEEE